MLPSGLAHCNRPKPPLLGPANTEPWPAANIVSCADSLECKGGSLASKANGASARPSGLPFTGLLEGEPVGLMSALCTLSTGALGRASAMSPKLDWANGFAKTGKADGADADTAVGESWLEAVGRCVCDDDTWIGAACVGMSVYRCRDDLGRGPAPLGMLW